MPDQEIIIIGAGLSGIGMGIALREAGIDDFVIYERADDVGGTWRDNTYPGVGVDIPAQAYQFSYELKPDWSRVFAKGREVKAYVDHLAEHYGIRPHIEFSSDVTARTWNEDEQQWDLTVNGESVTARYVISAIGPFVDPKPTDIPGADEFAGKVLQSARWDHDYDLTGKRVAVVGTGASAVQLVPEIAKVVGHLDVYQRTPIWVAPKLDPRTSDRTQRLFARVPAVQNALRATLTGISERFLVAGVLGYHRRPSRAVTHGAMWALRNLWYRQQVPDRELRRRLTPDYGLGCKRPAVSNTYLRTFTREHVELVTDSIERITPTGVQTVDGRHREVDVLVLATGFRMAYDPQLFRDKPVRGRNGFDLATFYDEHRTRSYEGVSMPGLPNHFMIFGPYGWTGGTWHTLVETASTHIVRLISEAQRRGATSVEVREDAADRWTAMATDRLSRSLWHGNACETANSYYFDQHGDTPYLRPTSAKEAWHAHRHFPFDDYEFVTRVVETERPLEPVG